MKLTATTAFVFSFIAFAMADASTIRIEYKDGNTQFLTEEGIVQEEYFTREQDPQAYCLAENIYFESRSDSLAGQAAVADVVINRVHDDRYPNTVCDVVRDGPIRESWKTRNDPDLPDNERVYYPIRNMCQFSWYCDGKKETVHDKKAWIKAQYIAYQMLYADRFRGITEGATHYHAHYVNPNWARKIQFIDNIGSHKFYRWP
jgi:spore germination cell wall hydrolase CwlJ-like protein